MNLPQTANRPQLIAGQERGKPVTLKPHLIPAYNRLRAAAWEGNYWAVVALRGLHALQTGVIGKDNIYVKNGGFPRGLQQFRVLLPGLIAVVERGTDDRYNVVDLKLSESYFSAARLQKTGLYRVTGDTSSLSRARDWAPKYVVNGEILPETDRVVAIADSGYGDAVQAAKNCAARLPSAPEVGVRKLARDGFDMHFTSGTNRLGGWRRYDALGSTVDGSYQSAYLLADAMERAKGITGVQWIGEYGGSLILTQAMKILVDRGVTLNGHTAFLYRPRTSPGQAVRLAHKLQMELDEKFADTGLNPIGALSRARSSGARMRDEIDPYGLGHCAKDWLSGVIASAGVLGAGAASAYYLGQAIPAMAVMTGIVGAIGTASTLISAAESSGKLGKQLAESTAHRLKIK